MPRAPRKQSESDIYHVIQRGTGRQLVFEDDRDRKHFLKLLRDALTERKGQLLAWCLMGNHVHLLVRMPMEDLSQAMMSTIGGYARFFNLRHGRTGHLFQDRFKSEPITDDSYLLTVVRYIHANPQVAAISPLERYRWSSYREYVGTPKITDTAFVLDVMGGVERFREFHHVNAIEAPRLTGLGWTRELSDEDAIACAQGILNVKDLHEIAAMPKPQRNYRIARLKHSGFSVRQIERLTGISRNIIAAA